MGQAQRPKRWGAVGEATGGVEIDGIDVVAILVSDFGYPLHLVRHLTRLQIARIFLRERYEDGRVKLMPRVDFGPDPHKAFYDRQRRRGMLEHEISRLWKLLEDKRLAEALAKRKRK
jgi:hypothetical protein